MKHSLINRITAFLVLLASVSSCTYKGGNGGEFITCPSQYFSHGLCGSGGTPECVTHSSDNKKYEDELTCCTALEIKGKNYTQITSDSPATYICKNDADIPCPKYQALKGICSSKTEHDCAAHCNTDYTNAVVCYYPGAPLFVAETGNWNGAVEAGVGTNCGANQIACGACNSAEHRHCGGEEGYSRIRCCHLYDCTPTQINGTWVKVFAGSSTRDSYTLEVGVTLEASHELTEGYGRTVSASMSKGFTFSDIYGASASVEQKYGAYFSQTYSASFSMALTKTVSVHCDFAPFVMWQFQFNVAGECPANIKEQDYFCTPNAVKPPCCLPGFNADSTYTTCAEGPNLCDLDNN